MAGLLSSQSPILSGLLGPNSLAQMNAPVRPVQAQPAPRRAVNPLRVALATILGGENPFDAADAERARLDREALRPQMLQRAEANRSAAAAMGPAALIAYDNNPEAFAESLGMQYRPVTTAAGSITSFGANGPRIGAPVVEKFDDRYGIVDPLNPQAGVTYTDPRGATRGEINAAGRLNLDTEAEANRNAIALGNLDVARDRLALDTDTAGFTVGQGQTRFDVNGNPIASVAPASTSQNNEVAGQLQSLDTEVEPALRDMRSLLESGDVITGFGAEARLQAARGLAAAGNEQARRQVAATERYRNLSGRLRVGMAKSLGANPSNADILLLERVTAGDIGQSREGLLSTIRDGEGLARRQRQALSDRRGASQAPAANGIVSVSTPQQAQALSPGTRYRTPDGAVYIR